MDTLSDSRFRGGIVLALILLNLILIAYVGWGMKGNPLTPPMGDRPENPAQRRIGRFIQQELALRPDQVAHYEELISSHQQSARATNQDIRKLKQALFSSLDKSEEEVATLLEEIGDAQQAKELLTYRHFADLRAICDPDQQKKLDAVLQEILRMMNRPIPPRRNGEKGPPPRRDGEKGPRPRLDGHRGPVGRE